MKETLEQVGWSVTSSHSGTNQIVTWLELNDTSTRRVMHLKAIGLQQDNGVRVSFSMTTIEGSTDHCQRHLNALIKSLKDSQRKFVASPQQPGSCPGDK